LITARLCADYNRELLVVPGSIFSKQHFGIHQFLKLGATPVTTSEDILRVLNIDPADEPITKPLPTLSPNEQRVLEALHEPLPKDVLIRTLGLDTATAAGLLMQMELEGYIVETGGMYRAGR
jgi:DNA processing protein